MDTLRRCRAGVNTPDARPSLTPVPARSHAHPVTARTSTIPQAVRTEAAAVAGNAVDLALARLLARGGTASETTVRLVAGKTLGPRTGRWATTQVQRWDDEAAAAEGQGKTLSLALACLGQPEVGGKAKYSAADRRTMTKQGAALADGSFPIADAEDLAAAVRNVGRGRSRIRAKGHIVKRARALRLTSELPAHWPASTAGGKSAGTLIRGSRQEVAAPSWAPAVNTVLHGDAIAAVLAPPARRKPATIPTLTATNVVAGVLQANAVVEASYTGGKLLWSSDPLTDPVAVEAVGLTMETKALAVAADPQPDGEGWVIAGTTGIPDDSGDRVLPGAYADSLALRPAPRVLVKHDWTMLAGVCTAAEELQPGDKRLPAVTPDGKPWPKGAGAFRVKPKFFSSTVGKDAATTVAEMNDTVLADGSRANMEWSVGYRIKPGNSRPNSYGGRDIAKWDSLEVSLVPFGMSPHTGAVPSVAPAV